MKSNTLLKKEIPIEEYDLINGASFVTNLSQISIS